MTLSGRLTMLAWQARLQLRKSELLRALVSRVRRLRPDTRERHLRGEVEFWRKWMATRGLQWPEDYAFRLDPNSPVREPLSGIIADIPQDHVDILDVGAGPMTVIGKLHPTKTISITATDVLGREYGALLDEFGLDPPVRTLGAAAENLREKLAGRSFDLVYAQNSLDHSADPVAGIEEMLALAKPGGVVVLLHEENEGINELYYALHKWDFTCENGHFIIAGPGPGGPRRDVTDMLDGLAEVECTLTGEHVLVVIRKSA